MNLKFTTIFLSVSLALTGCGTVKGWLGKRDNGSLDYQQSQKLDPVKLPINQQTATFTPLYSVPDNAPANTLDLTNESKSRYALPKPPTVNP
ncbi:MAG: hypothetical protein Q3971_09545 [Moraxella sp.]|nr:hypothetical protein [Moraxella sp.]